MSITEIAPLDRPRHAAAIRERLRNPPNAKPDPERLVHRVDSLVVPLVARKKPIPAVAISDHWPPIYEDSLPPIDEPIKQYETQTYARIDDVQRAVCRYYGVADNELISPRREARICLARQIAMWLAKVVTTKSMPEIGRRFGGRDHTTVLSACRKIDRLRAINPDLSAEIDEIRTRIEREFAGD